MTLRRSQRCDARLRDSAAAPPSGAAAGPSGSGGGASAAPGDVAHSERPPGTSSPVAAADASVAFDGTLPSALVVDSHGEEAWDHAGDLAAGAADGSLRLISPPRGSSRSRSPSVPPPPSRRESPRAAVPPPARAPSPAWASSAAGVPAPVPVLPPALAPLAAARPPAHAPPPVRVPPSALASSVAGVAGSAPVLPSALVLPAATASPPAAAPPGVRLAGAPPASGPGPRPSPAGSPESPGARAARLGALAADHERELLKFAQMEKVARAQRAAEERDYQKRLADRAEEQAAWDRRLADTKKLVDGGDDAVRRMAIWNKKLEQDNANLRQKLDDDVKKATAERTRLDTERRRLEDAVHGLQTDHAAWVADCARVQDQRKGEIDLLDRERESARQRGGVAESEAPGPPVRSGCGCG